jgi:hypothetical protein
MAIEKGIYAAPQGIDRLMEDEGSELEIEIVNPDMVTLDDGSMEITIIPEDSAELGVGQFDTNLAELLEESQLTELSNDLLGLVEADIAARKEWADAYAKGLEVLGFKYEERADPWEGACGVHSTVLAEAAIRFQAETMSETFPAAGPVKTKILGEETQDKTDAAARVRADMNYELTERMVEYRPEHERMLYSLGLSGSAFKKVYFDPNLQRQMAVYLPAEDVVVPYGASNIESAERVTHIMRKTKNEMNKLQDSGFYLDIDLGDPSAFHTDIEEEKAREAGYELSNDDRYTLYEIHADLVIEGSGDSDEDSDIAYPYVVTLERGSGEILGIRRNWEEDSDLRLKRQHFVHYVYVPGFGFYGLGLIHIIGNYARAGTSIIRQLVDAGTLSNLPGGLKTRGMRIKGDDTPIRPGEFKDVDVPSGAIRDNIMNLPYKEPSQTLLQLLNQITTEGRRLGAISDMNISDMSANAPVGTTLAILERTLKPMAAIQARVHYAMKQEFKLLKKIMAENAPEDYAYVPERGETSAKRSDYEMVDVIPVSDPNNTTMAQRVVQYQTALQMSTQAPQIYDLPELHRQMLEVLGVKNADKIVPTEEDQKPMDPVSENMNMLNNKPLKAFLAQDHEAHIATHTAFIKDPQIAENMGQNPLANQLMAAMQAHLAEHLGFRYRVQMEEKLGANLPPIGEDIPPEMESTLSQVMAAAGKQLTEAHQQEAAQNKAQQQAQDPLMQLKQAEVQLKQAEMQRKGQKDQVDASAKKAEHDRKMARDQADFEIAQRKMALEEQDAAFERMMEEQQFSAGQRDILRKERIDMMGYMNRGQ